MTRAFYDDGIPEKKIDSSQEDNHCLVVEKPAGILVEHDENHPAQRGLESALGVAKAMLKETRNKPGNVFLQPVNRIDQPVSGVVVFATTSKTASRLVEAFRERTVEKFYLTMIEGRMTAARGQLVDHIAESATKGVMLSAHKKIMNCSTWLRLAPQSPAPRGPRLSGPLAFIP